MELRNEMEGAQRTSMVAVPLSWRDRWLRDHGLKPCWCVTRPQGSGDLAGPFKLITHDVSGNPRPEVSFACHDRQDRKYMAPAGSGITIYAPRPDSWPNWNAARKKYLAEGHGKTIALSGRGLPTLGFPGIQAWHRGNGDWRLHNDLANGIKTGDQVVVFVDGDWHSNSDVAQGARRLRQALLEAGAESVHFPDISGTDSPGGIDDLMLHWEAQGRDPLVELTQLQAIAFDDQADTLECSFTVDIACRQSTRWIAKNVVPAGEIVAIVGPTSCGKTFLTMDLLLAAARGLPNWLGHKIKQSGLVVHITLEGAGLPDRLRAYQKHHNLGPEDPPLYAAIETPVNLRDRATTGGVIRAIRRAEQRAGTTALLIAVDTVNRAFSGGDENSSKDMGDFLTSLERLKAGFPGATIIAVHHTGKDERKGARGHSSFSANVGAELHIDSAADGTRTATVEKQRDGATNLRFNFKLDVIGVGFDDDGDEITSCVVSPALPPGDGRRESGREMVYDMLQRWWVDRFHSQPISRTGIKDHYLLIQDGHDRKLSRDEIVAAFLFGEQAGWAKITDKKGKNPNSAFYILEARPRPKWTTPGQSEQWYDETAEVSG